MAEICYHDPETSCFKQKGMDNFKTSKDLPSFLFDEDELNEMEAEETVQISDTERSLAEIVWQDDSAQLVLMAKHVSENSLGKSGREADTSGDQETLDPGLAARLLQLACRLDAVACAIVLIEGDAGTVVRINEMDGFGRTPLHNAAEMHSTKCIDLLLQKNAQTDLRSKDGKALLALDIALSSKRMQVDWSHNDSVEELLVLLRERDLSAIRLLAAATQEVGEVSYTRAMEGRIAELAVLLLVAADKVTAPVTVLGEGSFSAKKKRTSLYESVLGETLLLWEIERASWGPSILLRDRWESVESCLVKRRLLLLVIELLQLFGAAAAAGNDFKDKRGLPPLLRASQAGDKSVVKLLLKAGANMNETDAEGNSALHWCLRAGATSQDPRLTWLLIKHGAKVSQRNMLGLTSVHVAAAKGNYRALQILLLHAPECVDLASETKETPLFFAVKNEFLDCAKLLLHYGANTQAFNLRRQRPVDMAKSQDMRFILSPTNLGFLNRTSPPQEDSAFMLAKDELNEEAYEQILEMTDEPANADSTLNSSHPNATTAICRLYESPSGYARGAKFYYAHGEDDLRRADSSLFELKPWPSRFIRKRSLHPTVFCRKIFIGGLPLSVDSDYLKAFFQAEFGPVEEAIVIGSPTDGHVHSRGFGFVTFKQEETAANAVEAHFVTIFGKRVEIKSAVTKSGSVKLALSPSSLQQLIQKDSEFRNGEPAFGVGNLAPYYSKTDSNQQIVKPECQVVGPLTEESLPQWVSKFRKWLPVFLKEASKWLGPGERYPLSSLKGDFRATCGMELDHASLGFLKLSDFIRSFPGICRMRVVPMGNGAATHTVLLPFQYMAHRELLQHQPQQLEQQPLLQPTPISELSVDVSANTESLLSKKYYIGYAGSGEGSSNPPARDALGSINQRLRSTHITDMKHPFGRLDGGGGGGLTPPPSDGGRSSGSMQPSPSSLFEKQWDYYILERRLCIVCWSQRGWLEIIPCLHKICESCKVNRPPSKCMICNADVREFRLCDPQNVYSQITIVTDSDFPRLGTVKKSSLRSQRSKSVHAVPSDEAVCLIKHFCQGATATVVCVPCGDRVACRSCFPPSQAGKLKECLKCGRAVNQVEHLER